MPDFSVISFDIGGLTLYAFGLLLSLAGLLALLLLSRGEQRHDIRPGSAPGMLLFGGLLGLLMARLVYSLIQAERLFFDAFSGSWLGLRPFFALHQGGFSLYGLLMGWLLAGWLYARLSHQRPGKVLDWLALPAAVFLSLVSLGQILGGQGYGEQLELEALQFFPIAVQNSFEEWYLAVFAWQGLLLAGIAVYLHFSRVKGAPGDRMVRLLVPFLSLQIFLESLRQDAYLRLAHNAFIRISQVMALILLIGLLLLLSRRAVLTRRPRLLMAPWLSLALASACAIAAEFYEKLPLSKPLLYGLSLLALSLHAFLHLRVFRLVPGHGPSGMDLQA